MTTILELEQSRASPNCPASTKRHGIGVLDDEGLVASYAANVVELQWSKP